MYIILLLYINCYLIYPLWNYLLKEGRKLLLKVLLIGRWKKYGLIGIKTKNPEKIWMKPGQNQLTSSTGLINWSNRYCRTFSIFLKLSCLNNCLCLLFSERCLTTAGAEFHPETSCWRKGDFFRNSCPYLLEFPSGCKGSPAFLAGY